MPIEQGLPFLEYYSDVFIVPSLRAGALFTVNILSCITGAQSLYFVCGLRPFTPAGGFLITFYQSQVHRFTFLLLKHTILCERIFRCFAPVLRVGFLFLVLRTAVNRARLWSIFQPAKCCCFNLNRAARARF